MGKKRRMMLRYDETGKVIPCTVIEVEPSVVVQKKTKEIDGYDALQLAHGKVVTHDPRTVTKRVNKPLLGHFKKASVEPRRHLYETKLEKSEEMEVGQELNLSLFENVTHVDVTGVSRGKGYQGAMRRHGFGGGPAAHGSGFHRHAGSTGMRSTPGRCLPGGKKAGHMGAEQVTVQNLRVISVDIERHVLIVEGAVPGAPHGQLFFSPSPKKIKKKHR
jgi:large subunit ribosomal protein L3